MISEQNFLKLSVLAYSLCIVLILIAYLISFIDIKNLTSIIIPAIIIGGNFGVGLLTVRFSIQKSNEIFYLSVFGGMVVRLFAMLLTVFICLKFLELNPNSFIFSILFFYVFLLILEIIYLNLRKK